MKKEMKQVLWVVALFVILMTATGNLVSAAGFDWSDDTFGNACKKVYSVSFRSGGGASSADVYKRQPLLYIKNWKRNRNMVP